MYIFLLSDYLKENFPNSRLQELCLLTLNFIKFNTTLISKSWSFRQ
jgi:hypothetical protein